MTMTTRQRDLIRNSFAQIGHLGVAAGEAFYARLFQTAPQIRGMFPETMSDQSGKLVMALRAVVDNLDDWPKLGALVDTLARRHVDYGVRPDHYPLVGQVLVETLADALGDDFTDEVRSAWLAAYGALAGRMIETAYPETV